jgi:hypothetical protein
MSRDRGCILVSGAWRVLALDHSCWHKSLSAVVGTAAGSEEHTEPAPRTAL